MELTITNTTISCAHFVHTACSDSPCQNLHGHNYRIDVSLFGEPAEDGMLIDAKDIKILINTLDHKFLVPESLILPSERIKIDRIISSGLHALEHHETNYSDHTMISIHGNTIVLPSSLVCPLSIPSITAEHLADHLCDIIHTKCMMTARKIKTIQVTVYETDKISATRKLDIPNRKQ